MTRLQLPIVITPTRAELGARCHRRHFLSDQLGRARYSSPSLDFGTVIHSGVSAYWLHKTGRDKVIDPKGVMKSEWDRLKIETPKLSLAMADAMLDHYAANAQIAGPFTNQGNFELVDVEQRFEIPLRDVKLSFQCDRIAYDKEQNWLVVTDTKTAGRLDNKWDRQWETSVQMKLYRAGAKQVFKFDPPARVDIVVEGLLKDIPSEIRYYVCPEWSDGLLAEAAHNAYTIAKLDEDIIQQGSDEVTLTNDKGEVDYSKLTPNVQKIEEIAMRFTPVNYMDCFSYGIECPFRRLCVADVEQRVPILRAEYFEIKEESY